jgi:hypothetical protein
MAATGRAALSFDIEVQGAREVERELGRLPGEALIELRKATKRIAKDLASKIQPAGRRDSRQSSGAANTVRAKTSRGGATVIAGPDPMLDGSEFGAIRRFGWYADERVDHCEKRQSRPWGQHSYWLIARARPRNPMGVCTPPQPPADPQRVSASARRCSGGGATRNAGSASPSSTSRIRPTGRISGARAAP